MARRSGLGRGLEALIPVSTSVGTIVSLTFARVSAGQEA